MALVTVLAVLAGGCGGGEDRLSSDEYVAQLNEMCRDFGAREQKIGEPRSLADVAERGDQIAAAFEEAILRPVERLRAPADLSEESDRLRAVARAQHRVLVDLAEAARSGELARAPALASRNRMLNAEADALMRRLGAADCTE